MLTRELTSGIGLECEEMTCVTAVDILSCCPGILKEAVDSVAPSVSDELLHAIGVEPYADGGTSVGLVVALIVEIQWNSYIIR